jgi:hypothetical protein
MLNTTALFMKKDGKLIPVSDEDTGKLNLFIKSLPEGEKVEMYLSQATKSDKTIGQLAKVHALIRELANFTGHEFEEMKDLIKHKAGLYYIDDPEKKTTKLKSFSDCSKEELGSAIESCISIGHNIGYYVD